ncbi:hypothetical protein [Polaromonas sp.]|uniref:hypothetical protein n=1 Tax=Polaromonas sp. TaxID=1869339 RepID=UPI001820EE59|nr:hypothetical protein [Polaromonas sp.]NMM08217.1 hypothetical protein [Polaromonas sp.]
MQLLQDAEPQDISSHFQVELPLQFYKLARGPLSQGVYVACGQAQVGQWALIPDASKTMSPTRSDGKRMSINNCRSSGMITT